LFVFDNLNDNDYYSILYDYIKIDIIWGLGIGDWGLGIGDWAQSPIPNPQSPIPILLILLLKLLNKEIQIKFFNFLIFNF